MKCEYGCGREGKHQLKNGKWCCSKHFTKCPFQRKKSSKRIPWNKGKTGLQVPWNKNKKGIYSKETLKKMSEAKKGKPAPWAKKSPSKESIRKMKESLKGRVPWIKGKRHTDESKRKMSDKLKGRVPWIKGKHHTNETRKKLRLFAIKQREERMEKGHQIHPNYNPDVCNMIDKFNKKYGYNLQHAQNGGEYFFEELGYWVDGWDEDMVTVFEGDEPFHYDSNGNLLERDIRRQTEIEEYLMREYSQSNFIRKRIYKYGSNTTLGRRRSISRT
jgi:hypothetical protein